MKKFFSKTPLTEKLRNKSNKKSVLPSKFRKCYDFQKKNRKFLSEDLTGSWSMPEMNHLSTTREGHLNHLIFRLFIKMKKKSRMILNWVKSQLNRKINFLSNLNPSLTLLDSKNDTDHVILVISGSLMVS